MTDKVPGFGSTELARLLATMNEEGRYPISVLTDRQGFPIAVAATPGEDPGTQAAVVALVQRTAVQVSQQLGMAQPDEISLYDTNGRRLVCRLFSANSHEMILAVVIPDKHQSHRRLTNTVLNTIQRQWKL